MTTPARDDHEAYHGRAARPVGETDGASNPPIIPGSNFRLGLAFGDLSGEEEHRRALRDACKRASRREQNYDQPWWAANAACLLEYVEACEAALRCLLDTES